MMIDVTFFESGINMFQRNSWESSTWNDPPDSFKESHVQYITHTPPTGVASWTLAKVKRAWFC